MGLNSETKRCNCIINFPNSNSANINIINALKSYLDINAKEYYFIIHDLDTKINENGEQVLKIPHIHLLFETNDNKKHRLSYYLNRISDSLDVDTSLISLMIWKNYESDIQYLIHKNDKDKFLYDVDSIVTNMSKTTLSLILEREVPDNITIEYLKKVIIENNGKLSIIYSKLGLSIVKQYRSIICDLHALYVRNEL